MAKLVYKIWVDTVEKTKINMFQLAWVIDTVLSNPINARYRSLFDGKYNLLKLFKLMTKGLKDDAVVKMSNGTKKVQHTVKDWTNIISMNLSMFNDTPESDDRNVWISVNKKNIDKEPVKLDTLG